MKMTALSKSATTIEFTSAELALVNNALNEVCHGVQIDDGEFSTRLGASRGEAQSLMLEIGALIERAGAL